MLDRILAWFQRLPAWGTGLLVLLLAAVVVGGGIAGYRTYDYVQHDNEFCLSCHLMEEPYQRFAQSAHRGLGCKACHQPTFAVRSEMALTQIIESPDTLAAHAEVPNERCASCHIEGDPEQWELVKNSAGHRIHFESDDPSLEGLRCVQCHSSGVHEFAPVDRTCGQSGCHTDTRIQLGGMSDLTIHCVACHDFSRPVDPSLPVSALTAAVTPDAEECLSCHVMRTLVEMPPDEPHDQACGTCHNPHEQSTPHEAVESCASGNCHSDPLAITPMHRGLDPGVLEDCTTCHEAHEWRVEAGACLTCHQEIFQDTGRRGGPGRMTAVPPTGPLWPAPRPGAAVRVASLTREGLTHGPSALRPGAPPRPHPAVTSFPGVAPVQVTPDSIFRHADHRNVACLNCHSTEESHGQVKVTSLTDCQSCHHSAPTSANCLRCHQGGPPSRTYEEPRTLSFTVRAPFERDLPFNHAPHEGIDCAECHTRGLPLSAAAVDCTTCHDSHHQPEGVRCASCHRVAPVSAHPSAQVHVGCTGSGCHTDPPFEGLPRTRDFCLSCHQDQVDHRPGRNCAECHQVPGRLPGRGGG